MNILMSTSQYCCDGQVYRISEVIMVMTMSLSSGVFILGIFVTNNISHDCNEQPGGDCGAVDSHNNFIAGVRLAHACPKHRLAL